MLFRGTRETPSGGVVGVRKFFFFFFDVHHPASYKLQSPTIIQILSKSCYFGVPGQHRWSGRSVRARFLCFLTQTVCAWDLHTGRVRPNSTSLRTAVSVQRFRSSGHRVAIPFQQSGSMAAELRRSGISTIQPRARATSGVALPTRFLTNSD